MGIALSPDRAPQGVAESTLRGGCRRGLVDHDGSPFAVTGGLVWRARVPQVRLHTGNELVLGYGSANAGIDSGRCARRGLAGETSDEAQRERKLCILMYLAGETSDELIN